MPGSLAEITDELPITVRSISGMTHEGTHATIEHAVAQHVFQ